MDKNSLEKGEIRDFLSSGETKQISTATKEKTIYFDGTQYSVKLPKKFMDAVGYKEGDKLVFKLVTPTDLDKDPHLEIEYRRKNES